MLSGVFVGHKQMCREEIIACLQKFDTCFDPPFSSSVDLTAYADKLFDNASFIIAQMNESIVGMIAYYKNRFGVVLEENEIMSVYGSQEGMTHLPWAFCDPGDLVLLPDPGYPTFRQ